MSFVAMTFQAGASPRRVSFVLGGLLAGGWLATAVAHADDYSWSGPDPAVPKWGILDAIVIA